LQTAQKHCFWAVLRLFVGEISPHRRRVNKGERIDLTPKKFDFLAYLARYVGKVCTRRVIVGYRQAVDAV
jgi:DNA-binding response OmpR family regulator